MIGISVKDGFIDFSKTVFKCRNCGEQYNDSADKYLMKCQRNKNGMTEITCKKCGKPFFMTYNYLGNAVSFL